MIVLRQILVPTDFSDASEAPLKYGRAFAEAFSASLHILHVIEDPFIHAWTPDGYAALLPRLRDEMEKDARDRLSCAIDEEERAKYRAQLVTRWGNPYVEIIRYAKEQEADLIVMGTHGRGAVTHMLLGSVAEKVVRRAPCPVLTVRAPEQSFVAPQTLSDGP